MKTRADRRWPFHAETRQAIVDSQSMHIDVDPGRGFISVSTQSDHRPASGSVR